MAVDTIVHRLLARGAAHADAPAYYVRRPSGWEATTWSGYAGEVRRAAKALVALGFEPGQAVGILGFNRPEWVVMDLAAMAAGGAPAGIYTTCSPAEVQYILHHAEAPVVLVEDEAQWRKVKERRDELPHLRRVVTMRGCPPIDDPLVQGWDAFLASGDAVPDDALQARLDGLTDDGLATLIYTSGTTGPPKGVMLSHRNLVWTADCAEKIVPLGGEDCGLSYLPLSHIAEQMFTLHLPISRGGRVYFAESIAQLPANLVEVQPTVFFGVPRIWEKLHAGVAAKLAETAGVQGRLVRWARSVATRVNTLRNRGEEPTGLLRVQYRLAERVVLSKVKQRMGLSRARFCVSGAAPISAEVLDFLASLDIVVLEVYGQSEGTGPTTFNQPGRTRFGTVGPVIPGATIRIAEDGEVQLSGPNVFLGYFKDPAATATTLVDGWLCSGDLGAVDADGFLTITGRKKDILITAGGKNIAPKNIEAALKDTGEVSEAVVIGDRRKFLTALVTIDPEKAAAAAGAAGVSVEAWLASDALRKRVEAAVARVNADLAQVEQIKRFTILSRPFGIETGELTPTLKVKRAVVAKTFAAEIEAMYAGA